MRMDVVVSRESEVASGGALGLARAASGHAAAVPPSSVMNSRLLICSPQAGDHTLPHR